MRLLLIAATLALLSGCMSYAERQTTQPDFVAATAKSPDDYISCAAPKFLAFRGETRVLPDGTARVIVLGNAMNTGVTLTAAPDGGETSIILRMSWGHSFAQAIPLAASCL